MQFCLYPGKRKIKTLKLSKNGKERMLATKEMSEKGPERRLATKKCSGKGESRSKVKRRDFKGILFCHFFMFKNHFSKLGLLNGGLCRQVAVFQRWPLAQV
jgi:hypothetical protein